MQTKTILAGDHAQSVIVTQSGLGIKELQYSPYGHRGKSGATPRTGFTGQYCEFDFGWYFLGNGYRVYNPVIMRFHSPDVGCSPFGRAGINSYAYVTGNPIGLHDRSGRYGEDLSTSLSIMKEGGPIFERAASYFLNAAGIIVPIVLWSEMTRRGVPVSGWTQVAFSTSIVSGGVGLFVQFLSENGLDHPALPYIRGVASLLTFASVVAGGVQAHNDNRTFWESQNTRTPENLPLHVLAEEPPMPHVPSTDSQQRIRKRSISPMPPSSVLIESPPGSPPAGPQRHSRSDLGNLTRFGFR